MSLSWSQYNLLYYLIQYGLFIAIYIFLIICIPYDLMGWIAETVLFLKDDDNKKDKTTNENTNSLKNENPNKLKNEISCGCIWKPFNEMDTNEHKNGCSCCCIWMPLEDADRGEREYEIPWRCLYMPLNDKRNKTLTSWRSWCCIRWLLKDRKTKNNPNENTKKKKNTVPPPWCTCLYIWKFFAKIFQCACKCWACCKCRPCCKCCVTSNDCENCLINCFNCCCECDCGDDDLDNKLLPHFHHLNLQKTVERKYCGFIYLNFNRIGLYLLLCAALWSATVVFFEGIILGYATAKPGDSCPTPKRGTPATIVNCFIFQNAFDVSPINTSFPTPCNSSMSLPSVGSWAACFTWIYADVQVVDVIEELGICAGIVALFGSFVAVMSYLCQTHRWRFLFDHIAALAVAAIPLLIYARGDIPFMTYILLGSLAFSILITEYLLHYVPLLTWLCFANRIFKCIQYHRKPNIPRVTVKVEPVDDSYW